MQTLTMKMQKVRIGYWTLHLAIYILMKHFLELKNILKEKI